jgi:small ligand-binding sensory domain FIST
VAGRNALWLDGAAFARGAVGVALSGAIAVDTLVAQGCRPVGRPMLINRGRRNLVLELDGRSPVAVLRELYESLTGRDRELFQHSLFIGLEMRGEQVEFQPGELLVRNLLGVDPEQGTLAIAAPARPWQVVQFLLRDARTAAEDLGALLDRYRAGRAQPRGALLFSCLGRGMHLYGRADHDTDLFRERLGPIPLGGFFCNGEIGPVGGTTFVHGYTSSFGLFREC